MFLGENMKKIILSFMLLFTLLMVTSCAVKHIEDTNGPTDQTLCELSNDELTIKNPKFFTQNAKLNSNKDKVKFTVNKMSGVKIIHSFTVKADETYHFNVKNNVFSGNAKIYVYNNGNIIYDILLNNEKEIDISNVSGKTEFRIAAESAKLEIEIVNKE